MKDLDLLGKRFCARVHLLQFLMVFTMSLPSLSSHLSASRRSYTIPLNEERIVSRSKLFDCYLINLK